jgi:four helix bundle protein
MNVNSYKDLIVWQKSMVLITDIYDISKKFPSSEIYGLTSQMRRAACSISLNIAEGWGRQSTKNYVQFLRNSRGSLLELENCILISANLQYLNSQEVDSLNLKITEVSKILNALIISLNKKIESNNNQG